MCKQRLFLFYLILFYLVSIAKIFSSFNVNQYVTAHNNMKRLKVLLKLYKCVFRQRRILCFMWSDFADLLSYILELRISNLGVKSDKCTYQPIQLSVLDLKFQLLFPKFPVLYYNL